MFVARWQIDARFGHKQRVIDLLRKWETEVGPQVGLPEMDFRLLTGSVGAREATVEAHHQVRDLAQIQAFFDALGNVPAHHAWGQEMEPHVVSGTSYWQMLRVL